MTESEFLTVADGIMKRIEVQADGWFDDLDIDVEATRTGGVLTLAFDSGAQVVINGQPPLQEMWVAAPRGGFHYRLEDGTWRDTRGGPNLAQALSEICSEAASRTLQVTI
ncbi:MAG: iron donor protein CyaY [Pigmentiphaga sp.]